MPSDPPDVLRPLEGDRLPFDYIKGNDFRVLRADGVIGGLTPNGHIHFALFSERQAIPRRLVHSVASDGSLGELIEAETVSRNSVVRELHADVFVTPAAARQLRDWLDGQLTEYEERRKARDQ